MFGQASGDTEGAGIWGDSLGAISHVQLSQGAFGAFWGDPTLSLVPPVSLLVGFPEMYSITTMDWAVSHPTEQCGPSPVVVCRRVKAQVEMYSTTCFRIGE